MSVCHFITHDKICCRIRHIRIHFLIVWLLFFFTFVYFYDYGICCCSFMAGSNGMCLRLPALHSARSDSMRTDKPCSQLFFCSAIRFTTSIVLKLSLTFIIIIICFASLSLSVSLLLLLISYADTHGPLEVFACWPIDY